MKHVLDLARRARVRHAFEVEAEVLALVPDADAGVPASLRLFLAHFRLGDGDVGASGTHVRTLVNGACQGAQAAGRRRRRRQLTSDGQRLVR